MDYSIVIKSSIEFVLVGPFDTKEGIYIKSDSVDIDVIGNANKVYQRGFSSKSKSRNRSVAGAYVWSRNYTLFDRNVRFLFFWRVRDEGIFGVSVDYNAVEDELNKFIENSFSELRGIIINRLNKESGNVDESKVLWDISPLILQCMNLI